MHKRPTSVSQSLAAAIALVVAAGVLLPACADTAGDGGTPAAALSVAGDSAFCVDLASRIRALEAAGVPQKLSQSSRTKVPLSAPDQVAAHDYLSATETHMFKCGLSSGSGLTKAP